MKFITKFATTSELAVASAKTDGSFGKPHVSLTKDNSKVHFIPYVDPYAGKEFVDLGLSVKWAKMNIGASSETDYGLYFQWGDVSGYTADQVTGSSTPNKSFSWSDYKYSNNGGNSASDMNKYNSTDSKTVLEVSDDAAVANMEGVWRMPTETEFNELLTSSTITKSWTSVNGVYGYKFSLTADQTKYVFFPAAGRCSSGSVYSVGTYGYYWSSSLRTSSVTYGRILYFYSSNCSMNSNNRCHGLSVRGVAV